MNIVDDIVEVKKKLSPFVKKRLEEFRKLGETNFTVFNLNPFLDIPEYEADIFSEACFCILTANSSAKLCAKIQMEIGIEGFRKFSFNKLLSILKKNGHRFADQRAKRIIMLRKKIDFLYSIIKEKNSKEIRKKLVREITGYGFKEASHFLRNIGFNDVAIIDRHIMNYLLKKNLITKRKSITPTAYLEAEDVLAKISTTIGIQQSELDLYIFYIQSGSMLK